MTDKWAILMLSQVFLIIGMLLCWVAFLGLVQDTVLVDEAPVEVMVDGTYVPQDELSNTEQARVLDFAEAGTTTSTAMMTTTTSDGSFEVDGTVYTFETTGEYVSIFGITIMSGTSLAILIGAFIGAGALLIAGYEIKRRRGQKTSESPA